MLVHWIWFAHRPGLNDRDKMALLQHFRDPEDIYFADDGAFDAIGLSEDAKTALREKNLTSAEEILAADPNGVMLSNGPGDPTDNVDQIAEIAKLFGRIPMFGICLGHQLMALAQGGSTVKLKYGHRGVNQPARDVCGTRTFLTSQNHGYAVVPESVKTGVIRYINANDGTCEGVDYPDLRAFSVQFHPEACSGPHDTAFLFDRFCDLMGGAHHAD